MPKSRTLSAAASVPELIGGFLVPVAVPLWMMRSDAIRTRDGGMAAQQAVLVSFAAYVMAAATVGDQGGVHWLSDVVAGGLMGWAIGKTVGEGFARGRLQPLAAPGRWGLQLTLNPG